LDGKTDGKTTAHRMALPVRHFFGGKGIVSLILLEKQEKEKTKGKKESLSENALS
jgi:hypothetical protein